MQTVVDLSRLRHNIRKFRATTRTELCAVVKADAYGHGIAVAPYIEPIVDCFMVATADEAQALSAVTNKPILMLGGDVAPLVRSVIPHVIPTVCDVDQLYAVRRAGYKQFSVAVNTGMNRVGADETGLKNITSYCADSNIKPWSVYSHLYAMSAAPEQSREFERLTENPILRGKRHLYSSNALDLNGFDMYDMTRCGIAMYGYHDGMDRCMTIRAKIVGLAHVPRGEHIGYGDYTLDHDALIATVRCGYADGLRRCDKQLYLTVRGKKCNVVGMPCMDLCMIDVTGLRCRVGEYAYIISQKSDAEYLAACYGTIVYEVLTGFNGRSERVYI